MNTHQDKTTKSKTTAASNIPAKQNSKTAPLVDNRPAIAVQRKIQEAIKNKPAVIQKKENKTGLPDKLKSGVENLSGLAMDDVKVHYNSDKPAQVQAHAYAQGTDIHLASGQEKHLPHEAWHVVQQKQGRVKPSIQLKAGVNINDDKSLEKEADIMGKKAIQRKYITPSSALLKTTNNNTYQLNRVSTAAEYGLKGAAVGAVLGAAVPVVGPWIGGAIGAAAGAIYGGSSSWNKAAAGSLNAELQAGLALAHANPVNKPHPLPAWVRTRVETAENYHQQIIDETNRLNAVNRNKYDTTPGISNAHANRDVWVTAQTAKAMPKFQNGLNLSIDNIVNRDFKWNEDYENRDGKIPGVKGAGGYREYYAEPAPGASGTWGRNRILRKTTAIGGHANSWWATSDHYGFLYKIN